MGVNIFLLPVILYFLPHKELGLWYVFASVATFIQLINFGFTPCLMRSIGHVWGGANDIQHEGLAEQPASEGINIELFNNVVAITRALYKQLGQIVLAISLTVGSVYIYSVLDDIGVKYAFCAWVTYSVGLALNMTFECWNVILRGIGCVADGQKANIVAKIVQIVVSTIGLLLGYGLVALSAAFLLSGIALRLYLRRKCIINLNVENVDLNKKCDDATLRRNLLYNAKKYGATVVSSQLVAQAFQLICASYFGLELSAEYGLTVQLIGFVITIAVVHFNAIVPRINICRITNKQDRIKELLASGACVYWILSILGIIACIVIGPWALAFFSKDNSMLPTMMTILVAITYFIENNRSMFTTFISTKNELPFTMSVIVCSCITVMLAFVSTYIYKSLAVLFIIRLVVEMSYNGWKWMKVSLNELDMTVISMFKETKNFYLGKIK